MFVLFDVNDDGEVGWGELQITLNGLGLACPETSAQGVIEAFDPNHDGCMYLEDFIDMIKRQIAFVFELFITEANELSEPVIRAGDLQQVAQKFDRMLNYEEAEALIDFLNPREKKVTKAGFQQLILRNMVQQKHSNRRSSNKSWDDPENSSNSLFLEVMAPARGKSSQIAFSHCSCR